MASPISFGDAYLLGRLAFKLGKAFTKGRKSAPAEFREVENQLYSLSAALQAFQTESQRDNATISLGELSPPGPSNSTEEGDHEVLSHIIESCKSTLHHLQETVTKYSVIGRPKNPQAKEPRFRKWHGDVKSCWKTLWWTTEGGDLEALRSNLTLHTNSLNLLLGVMVSSKTGRIEDRVDQIQSMLHEIHVWFTENLQSSTVEQPTNLQKRATGGGQDFELYTVAGNQTRLVCPHATVTDPSRSHSNPLDELVTLFTCQCTLSSPGHLPHGEAVTAYRLSPFSFCIRVAGKDRVLMLYKVTDRTDNSLVSLLFKRMCRAGTTDVEELFLQELDLHQSKLLIEQEKHTMLCHLGRSEAGGQQARILNLVRDTGMIESKIQSVIFESSRRVYNRAPLEFVQILHYKSTELKNLVNGHRGPGPVFHLEDAAEIILYFRGADGKETASQDVDIGRMTLHLKSTTKMDLASSCKGLVFDNAYCTGYTATEEEHPVADVRMTLHFVDAASCLEFKQMVEDMRTELFVMRLQYPRSDERKILQVQADGVYTEYWHIPQAEISILENTQTSRYRLTIVSQDGYSVFSQELAEGCFESLAAGTDPIFSSLSFSIQTDNWGSRKILSYPRGCHTFCFSKAEDKRLYRLALFNIAAVAPTPREGTTATLGICSGPC